MSDENASHAWLALSANCLCSGLDPHATPPIDTITDSIVVGAIGFEPTTPCSRSKCATRLRYAPTSITPPLLSDQFDEHTISQLGPVNVCSPFRSFPQDLVLRLADRHH